MQTLDLQDLRRRVLAGERLTPDIAQRVVEQLRSGRVAAVEASAASKRRGKSPVDESAIMADLDQALGL